MSLVALFGPSSWIGTPLRSWEQAALVRVVMTSSPGAAADIALLPPATGLPHELFAHGRLERLHDGRVKWTAPGGAATATVGPRPPPR